MSAHDWLGADPELPLSPLDLAFAQYLQQAQPSLDLRHGWLAALVSHQFGRGHACLDLDLLSGRGVLALGWETRWQASLPADLAQAASCLPWTSGPVSPLVLDGPRLYLRRNWLAEQSIRASILARLARPGPVPDGLAQALDSLFAEAPANPANATEAADTTNLTNPADSAEAPSPSGPYGQPASSPPDWQKIACALAARGRFTVITGGPGTGKTTTVVRLLALLQSQSERPLRVALAAPTGKAAARLGESIAQALKKLPPALQQHIPTQAQTLHKLLQVRAAVLATAPPELALDLVVVDEASMIDLELMARLLQAVPLSASLILLGDKDQLASVEAGAVLGQLCAGAQAGAYSAATVNWIQSITGQDVSAWSGAGSALAQQTVMLRHSHRFASGSQIGLWASAVNAGDRHAVATLWEQTPDWRPGQAASVTRLTPGTQGASSLAELVRAGWQPLLAALPAAQDPPPCSEAQALVLLQALGRFQLLCALREGPWGVLALNRLMARALGFPSEGWYAGRPVMVTRNDYNLGLMNGDIGLCLPTGRGLRVAFVTQQDDGPGIRWVLPSRLDAIETVFAMTVHKSQGSEFEQVALVLPDRVAPVLTRELLYTGITRAKKQLTLVVPQAGVLRQAVASNILRSGGLNMEKTQ
jgi:exodeoxyribonuclease V alpha subunit